MNSNCSSTNRCFCKGLNSFSALQCGSCSANLSNDSTNDHIALAKTRVSDLTEQIKQVQQDLSVIQESMKGKEADWTQSYQFWDKYEDTEELTRLKEEEIQRLKLTEDTKQYTGHAHDHDEERKIFELPEWEKMILCERHRAVGNYLFQEGLYPKAAEQYQLTLSYYEYCFPDEEEKQNELDVLRHVSLCNLSLCYLRMKYFRDAISTSTQAINSSKLRGRVDDDVDNRTPPIPLQYVAKAYYRRSQAYTALDEYDLAIQDLRHVCKIIAYVPISASTSPSNTKKEDSLTGSLQSIQQEIVSLQKRNKLYTLKSQKFAENILKPSSNATTTAGVAEVDRSLADENEDVNNIILNGNLYRDNMKLDCFDVLMVI